MLRVLLILLVPLPLGAMEDNTLDRIVVIGASVSRGFTKAEPFGGEKSEQLRLDRYLDAALTTPHGKIINDANPLLFSSVEKGTRDQLDRLARRKPTLVVGIDLLFWFLYGFPEKTGDRLELFDRGLELLSTIDSPLILGDIPDASAAIGHMLSAAMVPDAETRAEANRRLAGWAASRPNVSIIKLSEFVRSAEADVEIQTGHLTLDAGTTRGLLQRDRLHPTPTGCAALALAVMAKLGNEGVTKDQVLWDPRKIVKLTSTSSE